MLRPDRSAPHRQKQKNIMKKAIASLTWIGIVGATASHSTVFAITKNIAFVILRPDRYV